MPVLDENDCQEVMMDFDDLKVSISHLYQAVYTVDYNRPKFGSTINSIPSSSSL